MHFELALKKKPSIKWGTRSRMFDLVTKF